MTLLTDATNSYAFLIRDRMLERLKLLPYFAPFQKFGNSRYETILPEQLPYAAIYFMDELGSPDGDANAGPAAFTSAVRLGFSVLVVNNDPVLQERQLDSAFWAIMNGILRDPTVYHDKSVLSVEDKQPLGIEGFTRFSRMHQFGTVGAGQNQLPVVELRLELTATFRMEFQPVVLDDLRLIHMRTKYPAGVNDIDSTIQVVRDYEFGVVNLGVSNFALPSPVLGRPALTVH